MAELPRYPQRGDDILTSIRQLMDFIRRERVQAGNGILIKQCAGGKTISAKPGQGATKIDSFSFKKTDGANFYIYGGSVLWASWPAYNLPDDTFVTINGGTAEAPGCVALRLEWSLGPTLGTTLQFINAANPPDDDGTYGWRPLYQAWLVKGVAMCGRSKRHDWNITVPIGAA